MCRKSLINRKFHIDKIDSSAQRLFYVEDPQHRLKTVMLAVCKIKLLWS